VPAELLLSLPDVAELAGVRRPVVTVWRTRFASSDHPFPSPVRRDGSRELFALDDVVGWLETTGRGRSDDVRRDATLFAALDALPADELTAVVDGVTALLAVSAAAGEPLAGCDGDDVLDLADDVDPADSFAYSEVASLPDRERWLRYAATLAEAAYSPAEAFEHLLRRARRAGLDGRADVTLDARGVALAARLASELVRDAPVVDVPGSHQLLAALDDELGDADRPRLLTGADGGREGRLERRRMVARGWRPEDLTTSAGDGPAIPAGSLALVQLPTPARPVATDAEVLDLVDEVALAMPDDARAVVLAPSRALVDATRDGQVAAARAALLRTGRVRAVVRLPAGSRPTRSRERVAIWVLGPPPGGAAQDERVVAVADLLAAPDETATRALLTDVAAALGSPAQVRAHAFGVAVPVGAPRLQATRGDLVEDAAVPRRPPAPAVDTATVATLVEAARRVEVELPDVLVDDIAAVSAVATVSLGDLVRRGEIRLVRGTRLAEDDVHGGSGVRVLGPAEVTGRASFGSRAADRVTLADRYPSARYTEPGDVVFCTTPDAGAVVDTDGLGVVQYPARVLRVVDAGAAAGLAPLVARALRAVPRGADWRTARVPRLPEDRARTLAATLDGLAAARADLARRAAALDTLSDALARGVAYGTLTLAAAEPAPVEPDRRE
jgi:hypothetical protein